MQIENPELPGSKDSNQDQEVQLEAGSRVWLRGGYCDQSCLNFSLMTSTDRLEYLEQLADDTKLGLKTWQSLEVPSKLSDSIIVP